jgi:hypothetical protein
MLLLNVFLVLFSENVSLGCRGEHTVAKLGFRIGKKFSKLQKAKTNAI